MKRLGIFLIIFALCLSSFVTTVSAEKKGIAVYVDGAKLSFDVQPTILYNRTMVPMRKIFETLGAAIQWNDKANEVTATKGTITVKMKIDQYNMTKNGQSIKLDVAPTIVNDRTLVPVRAVAETFGADVAWDEANSKVTITTKKVSSYQGYPDVPKYADVIDCTLVSDKTEGKTRKLIYQLTSKDDGGLYQEQLEDMGYQLIDSSSTKTSTTKSFRNSKNPKLTLKVTALTSLKQTQLEIINTNIKIFIDAGHNDSGADIGANGNGLREQDITYGVAMKLGALLQKAGIEVKYSRPKKTDHIGSSEVESVAMRSKMANDYGADYFISIHCNAHTDTTINGTETFIYGAGGQAELLANAVQKDLVKAIKTIDRKVKVQNLGVLRKTNMPAILVETAFITNPNDAKILKDKQDTIAQGIYQGVCEYLGIDE